MEEDNDDQWLYGEESDKISSCNTIEKPENEISTLQSTETSTISLKSVDDDTSIEPPVIKPLDINTFEETAIVPGEEEILVPPVIDAPNSTDDIRELSNNETESSINKENENTVGVNHGAKLSDGEEEDDDDDNINVVIGDIRTSSYNSNLHIKRGNLLTLTKSTGKFASDDFESVGVINGVPAHEFNLDNLEDKPWRKPGADITDYFNYGFNEDTWRAYCERQKRIRVHESGSGLIPMNQQSNSVNIIPNVSVPPPNIMVQPMSLNNVADSSSGSITVIGNMNTRRNTDTFVKENTIQVMTADRREYSKKNFTPDLSVPPPTVAPHYGTLPPPGIPPSFPPINQYPLPPGEYFPSEMDPYYHSYEQSQDSGWAGLGWGPNHNIPDMKNVISINNSNDISQRPMNGTSEVKPDDNTIKIKTEPEDHDMSHDRERDRERDRSRDYERDRERDSRHRDRSHRHRSRSRSHDRRSRKHKSRSKSPGYRSHKKKKSKKSERSKSESD